MPGQLALEIADLGKGEGARVAAAARDHIVGDVVGIRHRLAPGRRIDAVIDQEMIEVRRGLLGDGGQNAEAHQDVALGIEQHDLLVRPRQRQAKTEAGMAAHRRVAELHVELWLSLKLIQ